uniref:collagen, type I, alpha 1a n=1 Tax=Myxine glutinosa TaxID=7769 RepID=UPI00358F3E13
MFSTAVSLLCLALMPPSSALNGRDSSSALGQSYEKSMNKPGLDPGIATKSDDQSVLRASYGGGTYVLGAEGPGANAGRDVRPKNWQYPSNRAGIGAEGFAGPYEPKPSRGSASYGHKPNKHKGRVPNGEAYMRPEFGNIKARTSPYSADIRHAPQWGYPVGSYGHKDGRKSSRGAALGDQSGYRNGWPKITSGPHQPLHAEAQAGSYGLKAGIKSGPRPAYQAVAYSQQAALGPSLGMNGQLAYPRGWPRIKSQARPVYQAEAHAGDYGHKAGLRPNAPRGFSAFAGAGTPRGQKAGSHLAYPAAPFPQKARPGFAYPNWPAGGIGSNVSPGRQGMGHHGNGAWGWRGPSAMHPPKPKRYWSVRLPKVEDGTSYGGAADRGTDAGQGKRRENGSKYEHRAPPYMYNLGQDNLPVHPSSAPLISEPQHGGAHPFPPLAGLQPMEVHGAAQLPSQTRRRPAKHEWGQVVGRAREGEPEEQASELSLRCPPGTHATQLLGMVLCQRPYV